MFARAADQARWPKILFGVVLILAVATPTLIIEESWHGKPMIDQPGQLWVIPTIVVAIVFAAGGAISARRISELWRALFHGLIVGTAASVVLLVANVVRRATVHRPLSEGVLRLWVEAALLSIVIASLGGAVSYLRSTRPT